jgi:D-glycero-alpha-D-manno-heptose-7-phosphate kinase
MLIRAKAPLRISFSGGGTDVPPFPQQEGGCVLSSTINHYSYGTLRPREDSQISIESLDYGLAVQFNAEDKMTYDGKLDLAKAAILKMDGREGQGFDLFLHSDAPPGSGLGASSAMMVALVGLMKEFRNLPMTDYDVAEHAYIIERRELAIQGGLQDQYAAAFGGFNYIEFLADSVIVNPLKIKPAIVNELQYNLLLCYTGQTRLSANIIEDQVKRYERKEADSLTALRELKHLTVEMKNLLLRGQLDNFGDLLHHEWEHKKKMSSKISSAHLDEIYDAARKEGVIGGKITGAGGGGYMLLYCRFDRRHKVAEKLTQMGCVVTDFAFEPFGLQTWRVQS